MMESAQIRVCGKRAEPSSPARIVVIVLLAVFCFQLSRFYLAIPLCSHHTRDGLALQHCKDSLSGSLRPVQLGGISPPFSHGTLAGTWESLPNQTDPKLDPPLSSFFHPPRS